jgi:hypothetical protein
MKSMMPSRMVSSRIFFKNILEKKRIVPSVKPIVFSAPPNFLMCWTALLASANCLLLFSPVSLSTRYVISWKRLRGEQRPWVYADSPQLTDAISINKLGVWTLHLNFGLNNVGHLPGQYTYISVVAAIAWTRDENLGLVAKVAQWEDRLLSQLGQPLTASSRVATPTSGKKASIEARDEEPDAHSVPPPLALISRAGPLRGDPRILILIRQGLINRP